MVRESLNGTTSEDIPPRTINYLRYAVEKSLHPLHCEHVNSVCLEFTDELSFSEVEGDDVCLVTYVHVRYSAKSMRELNKLGFAGEIFMMVGVEDLVCFQVMHEVAHNDVFY